MAILLLFVALGCCSKNGAAHLCKADFQCFVAQPLKMRYPRLRRNAILKFENLILQSFCNLHLRATNRLAKFDVPGYQSVAVLLFCCSLLLSGHFRATRRDNYLVIKELRAKNRATPNPLIINELKNFVALANFVDKTCILKNFVRYLYIRQLTFFEKCKFYRYYF